MVAISFPKELSLTYHKAMKLCCFDIDGTLMPFGASTLSEGTISALNALLRQGDAVCIASGRSLSGVSHYLGLFAPGKKYAIVGNGAALYDGKGKAIYEHPMGADDVYRIYDHFGHIKGVTVYAYDDRSGLIIYRKTPFVSCEMKINNMAIDYDFLKHDYRGSKDVRVQKVMVAAKEEVCSKLSLSEEEQKLYVSSRSAPWYFEILPLGCSKGALVERLREHLAIEKKDVYVFGDADNDLSMIRMFTSVAPANAIPSVKEAATYLTKDCAEDGVAYALKSILKII